MQEAKNLFFFTYSPKSFTKSRSLMTYIKWKVLNLPNLTVYY